jgi:hypothetical protein
VVYEITTLSVYSFVSIYLSVYFSQIFKAMKLTKSVCSLFLLSLNFVRSLMRPPTCLCVYVLLIYFYFYAVRVVSKENRQLVLARISYLWHLYFLRTYENVLWWRKIQFRDFQQFTHSQFLEWLNVFVMSSLSLSVCTNVYVPRVWRFDDCYSYSTHRNLSVIGQYPLNANITVPNLRDLKRDSETNIKIFRKWLLQYSLKHSTLWRQGP